MLHYLTISLKFVYVSDFVRPGCCACRKQGVLIFQGDFSNGSYRIEPGYGVSWINPLTGTGYCNMEGVLNVTFPLPVNGVQRRFLRFHFYLTPDQTGYNFQVADSISDGHGGEAADIHNRNTEVQVIVSNVNGYRNYSTSGLIVDRITKLMVFLIVLPSLLVMSTSPLTTTVAFKGRMKVSFFFFSVVK